MNRDQLIALAKRIDACVEDARRPRIVLREYEVEYQQPDSHTLCLANGLEATAAALRALAGEQP